MGTAARNRDWLGWLIMAVHISGHTMYLRSETNDAHKNRHMFRQNVITDSQ